MRRGIALAAILIVVVLSGVAVTHGSVASAADNRLQGAFRKPAVSGWTFVHVQGTPAQIGYQHGYLLSAEILDLKNALQLELTHDNGKDWNFFRDAAKNSMWPHISGEYREELQGIADGLDAHGVNLDLWDVVAMNAAEEWSYYVGEWNKQHRIASPSTVVAPDHCSAFVATGSYTKDGKIVIAHNDWTGYLDGARWTIVLDVVPAKGYRFIMDTLPGFIHSGDDFAINSAGIILTETTITGFSGYDFGGIPEFVRARKAMQYSASIDEVANHFKEGNNGGYANDWLIGDTKKNEIASLELGLKNVTLERKTDGYFAGSNFPINPKLAAEETNFNLKDPSLSANARHKRWTQLLEANKGKIDVALAQEFLADHVDSFSGKTEASERTLCGHVEDSPRGMGAWQPPYGTAGAVQNKVTDASLAAKLSFTAAAGHACGKDFIAAKHLAAHPELSWQKPELRDMKAFPWTTVAAQ
ncbi:MAG: peptidase C45 [Acidobacteria bacterium]|nr:peptidase C45 [Acidobacteriota bacterium]MBS1864696.1 peptidase C45 [Acidobacteriota bacterium]